MRSRKQSQEDTAAESWYVLAINCAVRIREQFGPLDKNAERKIVRAFRCALRPRLKPGRKPAESTVLAAGLWSVGIQKLTAEKGCRSAIKRQQRRLWQSIYLATIPGFARMDKPNRQYAAAILRRNVKAYLRRNRHK